MLSSVLALITCATIPVDQPLDVAAQMSASSPAVEVGIYTTDSSFQCRNFSATNYLLVFAQAGSPITVTVALPPGGTVGYSITPATAQGTVVEAIAVPSPTSLVSSGSISLAIPSNSSDQSLWFVPGLSGLVTWRQIGCNVEVVQPGATLLPNGVPADVSEDCASSAAQVPVRVPARPASNTAPQSLPPM